MRRRSTGLSFTPKPSLYDLQRHPSRGGEVPQRNRRSPSCEALSMSTRNVPPSVEGDSITGGWRCGAVSVDWASDKHDVLVADGRARSCWRDLSHDEKGVIACVACWCVWVVLVAIERPDGLLVERLLDAGLRVLALHPNKVAARVTGSGSRVGSPIGLTHSCSVSSRAPIITASGCSSPIAIRRRRSGADPRARGSRRGAHGDRQPAPCRA